MNEDYFHFFYAALFIFFALTIFIYWGPAEAGKTTSLMAVAEIFSRFRLDDVINDLPVHHPIWHHASLHDALPWSCLNIQ